MVRIDWSPDDAGYRRFGRTLFIGFSIIGLLVWAFGGSFAATRESGGIVWGPLPWFVLIPGAIMLLAWVAPRAAQPFYLAWMAVAFVMGTIISTVLLAAIYWILFGFVSLCFRLKGRDRLRIKPAAGGDSRWVNRGDTIPRERYERQF
ncbi:MAG: hypothetical protein ACYTGZ_01855 [Planctomycetota bacterium]|jgi:hypothetical protein